jgi:hypothetical protein
MGKLWFQLCTDLHICTCWPKDNWSLAPSCIKQMSKYKLCIIKTMVIKPVLNEGLLYTRMLLFGEPSSIYYWWILPVSLPLNAAVSLKWKGTLITSRSVSSFRSCPYFFQTMVCGMMTLKLGGRKLKARNGLDPKWVSIYGLVQSPLEVFGVFLLSLYSLFVVSTTCSLVAEISKSMPIIFFGCVVLRHRNLLVLSSRG